MPTFAEVLAEINANIVPNGNNEITADVLRPILEAMLQQPSELIGDMTELTTAETATLVDAINSVTAGINQDNIPRIITFTSSADDANPVTPADVATMVNAVPGGYVITDTNTPVIISVSKAAGRYIFLYKKGKGIMGGGASTSSDFFLLAEKTLTETDLNNDPDATIIPLGEVADGDYVAAANTGIYDFSDSGETAGTGVVTYYFSYIEDAVLYFVLFVGVPGIYGNGETAFTEADFVASTNSTVEPGTPIPTIDQVLASGHIATNKDLQVEKRIDGDLIERTHLTSLGLSHKIANGNASRIVFAPPSVPEVTYTIPAKEADDTVAMLSDIGSYITEIPKDFFMSCTIDSSLVNYKTDIYRTLDLEALLPPTEPVYITSQIVRLSKNNFFIVANSSEGYVLGITLKDCRIIDNHLIVGSIEYSRLTNPVIVEEDTYVVENRIHGALYSQGFIYLSTRHDNLDIGQRIFKINPYDLSDVKSVTLPTTVPYRGQTTEIRAYKNYIYMLLSENTIAPDYIVRVSENLEYEMVFECSGITSANRIRSASPFIIYNDEIYIPTVTNLTSGYDVMGVNVYSMTGTLTRYVTGLNVGSGNTSGVIPHWITIFNNKLLVTTSGSNNPQFLARIDCESLALDDVLPLSTLITHRNSLFSDGYLYLNEEVFYNEEEGSARLLKIKYNDFTDFNVEIATYGVNGKGSYGSIEPYVEQESLKTKLSDFENDINAGIQDLQSVLENGSEASVDETISITNTTVGALTIASESMSFEGMYGGINFNSSQAQITSGAYDMHITAGAGGSINFDQTTGINISGNAGGVTIDGSSQGITLNGSSQGVEINGQGGNIELNGSGSANLTVFPNNISINGTEDTNVYGQGLNVTNNLKVGATIFGDVITTNDDVGLSGGSTTRITLKNSSDQLTINTINGTVINNGVVLYGGTQIFNGADILSGLSVSGEVLVNGSAEYVSELTPTLSANSFTHKAYVDEAISTSIPEGIITLSPESPETITNVWYGTQAEYDAIISPDPDTEYNIEDDYQEFKGSVSFVASGSILTIPHSLGVMPVYLSLTPKSNGALYEYVTADEDNIYVHFAGPNLSVCEYWIQYNN